MKLSNNNILPLYKSVDNDIISEFYIPLFSSATNYDRVSAYFDSKILSFYSNGLEEIYKNNGKVRFIFSYQISKDDYDLMVSGYEKRQLLDNELSDRIDFELLTDEEKNSFKNLSYLIQIGLVDIKIALTPEGIFHDKYGLIYNNIDNEYVYFRGSNNETVAAVRHNYESFETTCSWNASELECSKITTAKDDFEKLWNNNQQSVLVIDLPDVIKNKILSYSEGRIIDTNIINVNNKLVLDLGNNKTIIYKNFLVNNRIDFRDLEFKVMLKRYILSFEGINIVFKDELNYVEMKKIRDCLIDYSTRKSFDIYITDKLNNYIYNMDLELENRIGLGIDIKHKESYLKESFESFINIVNKEMTRQLRPEQAWNSYHIISMIRSANFSVPGSGKTSIVYGAFSYLSSKEKNMIDKLIVIGPINSFISWKEEFVKCFGDKRKLAVIDTQTSEYKNKNKLIEKLKYDSGKANLILINYEKLDSIQEDLITIINDRTMLVFDEAHKIKAVGGIRAKAALKICKNAKYKVVLTGTPIPNSYEDLYNMLHVLYPEEYDSFFKFQPHELKNANEFKAKKINDAIFPFFCRTTKKDLNIPVPDEPNYIDIQMNAKEKRLFELIHQLYSRNILTLYIRLLQATVSPKLLLNRISKNDIYSVMYSEEEDIDDNELYNNVISGDVDLTDEAKNIINSIEHTSKFNVGIDEIKKLVSEGKQVLVWGIFINTLYDISNSLNDLEISNVVICGQVNHEDRENMINQFKNGDVNVLITNPHTLAESVSLHENCHDAIYFEYSFNLTHMLQSRDRINRLGLKQDDYTRYNYLILSNDDIYNDSIDKKTLKRLNEKEEIMIKSIEGTDLVRVNFDDMDDIKRILGKI